jgi:hypothetical protein
VHIDPFEWLTVGREERQTPLGTYRWAASFWKMTAFGLIVCVIILGSYLSGKSVSNQRLQAAIRTEVRTEMSTQLKDVSKTLATIQIQLDEQRQAGIARDKKLDKIMLQPRYRGTDP